MKAWSEVMVGKPAMRCWRERLGAHVAEGRSVESLVPLSSV